MRDLLRNLRLTLLQWVTLSLAGASALLFFLLKRKDGELRRARVKLLEQEVESKVSGADEKVGAAREKYEKARDEYVGAGGRMEE